MLAARQERAREIAAISRWRGSNIDDSLIADLVGQPARNPEEAIRVFQVLRSSLVREIAVRGDKRITDPKASADAFLADVVRDGWPLKGEDQSPTNQLLVGAGLDPEDIDPSATFAETMNLLTFHKRLRIVAQASSLPWAELKRTVTRRQLPVAVIEECMRAYAHDQPERKGSELNDTHLLCLAPYADVTYVDRRTLESVRRAKRKDAIFDQIVGRVARAGSYADIAAALTAA